MVFDNFCYCILIGSFCICSDQLYPSLGYGAKIPPAMEVSHCFALNFNASNPFCAGDYFLYHFMSVADSARYCSVQHC